MVRRQFHPHNARHLDAPSSIHAPDADTTPLESSPRLEEWWPVLIVPSGTGTFEPVAEPDDRQRLFRLRE